MNTIEELVYYCNEPDPVGALMLTGEWGCGKTYLLEHQLVHALKDSHIIVRVSLFGVESIDALNTAVKKQWAAKCFAFLGKIQNQDKAVNAGKSILNTVASAVPVLKDVKDSILTINPLDFLTIEPKVDTKGEEKRVVLVFDDLERSKLDTIGVLGCINEYCENLHFNTIVVANEEKIDSENGDGISYVEIKEKIIARTVQHKPDYEVIVGSLIDNKKWFDEKYTEFLRENKRLIQSVFSTEDSTDEKGNKIEKPHNIRSLKCALQDFHRLYTELVNAELPELEKYFYSFIAYIFAAKSGIAKEGDYGYIFADTAVQKYYPFYSDQKMFRTAQDWIHHGEWNSDQLNYEISLKVEQLKEMEPKDKLRVNRFIDLDEEIITAGFDGLLEYAYQGRLTINEYVQFIENSYFTKEYSISTPLEIDWKRVEEGLQIRFQKDIENGDDERHYYREFNNNNKSLFTVDEWNIYELIKNFRETDQVIFEGNRRLYIDGLTQNGINGFAAVRNKRLSMFDDEMIKATVEAFEHSTQSDKVIFPECFSEVWQNCDTRSDVKREATKAGFEKLVKLLDNLKTQYKGLGKNIAAKHTEVFISIVQELIEKLDTAIRKEVNES